MSKIFCVKTYTSKGMITVDDTRKFKIQGYPGDVWEVENNLYGQAWITRNGATIKTLEQAQTIVNDVITNLQTTWDGDNVEGETEQLKKMRLGQRPISITLSNNWS